MNNLLFCQNEIVKNEEEKDEERERQEKQARRINIKV